MANSDWTEWAVNRQNAVELLATEINHLRERRPHDEWRKIELPDPIWSLILAAALGGLHKGKGRGGPQNTRGDKLRKDSIVAFAVKRKRKLMDAGMKATGANSADDQAAEEARVLLNERYGLNQSVDTIKRKMQKRI